MLSNFLVILEVKIFDYVGKGIKMIFQDSNNRNDKKTNKKGKLHGSSSRRLEKEFALL